MWDDTRIVELYVLGQRDTKHVMLVCEYGRR